MLTYAIMHKLWPHAPLAKVHAIVEIAPEVLSTYGITSPLRLAHFMAQVSHENTGGTASRENMNYSADQLMRVFGVGKHSAKVTAAEAVTLARHPEQIAERVYGVGNPKKSKELGNTRPGDGWKYRGGGDLQGTGGKAYKHLSEVCGIDLYENPDLIADPNVAFRAAAAEFQALNCLPAADKDSVELVTRRVNGGKNGLAERSAWLRKWKVALPQLPDAEPEPDEPVSLPRGAEQVPEKTLSQSNIIKGAVAAGTASAPPVVGAVIKAGEGVQDAAPGVSEHVTEVVDRAGKVIETVKTVQESVPDIPHGFWQGLGHVLTDPIVVVCFGTLALGAIAFIFWERRRKLREEGV